MLFSDDQIAQYINDHFEPAWESVRDVPLVRIDFGNGNVLTRTLNGNVATYVCAADGSVLDVLPGIYEPETYRTQLAELVALYHYVEQESTARHRALKLYHQRQAAALAAGRPRAVFVEQPFERRSIVRVERGVKLVLQPADRLAVRSGRINRRVGDTVPARLTSTEDLAGWQALADDTRLNETVRRRQIHAYLAARDGWVQPVDLTKWLYREVLHADLDDPYMGLGKVLFASYPFAEEDASDERPQ